MAESDSGVGTSCLGGASCGKPKSNPVDYDTDRGGAKDGHEVAKRTDPTRYCPDPPSPDPGQIESAPTRRVQTRRVGAFFDLICAGSVRSPT
jgi:hypothetical protein